MNKKTVATDREAAILSILSDGKKRYGREIRDKYEEATHSRLPLGSLYTTLERIRAKGFIESRKSKALTGAKKAHDGRRTSFWITGSGLTALRKWDEVEFNKFTRIRGLIPNGR